MKLTAIAVALAVAASLAIVSAGSGAHDDAQTSGRNAPKAKTLRYVIRFAPPTFVDHPPAGFNKGDNVVIEGEVFDQRNTSKIGRHYAYCSFVIPGQILDCTSSTVIDGQGMLVAEGVTRPGGEGVNALVGGTRDFKGAQGTRTLVTRPRTGEIIEADLTFRRVR